MGEVRSKVIYSLAPDVKGTTADEDALVRFERDLIESVWKKELVFGAKDLKEICVGGWNISHTAAAGGKTKKDRSGSAFAAPHAERRKSGTGGPRVGLEDLFC